MLVCMAAVLGYHHCGGVPLPEQRSHAVQDGWVSGQALRARGEAGRGFFWRQARSSLLRTAHTWAEGQGNEGKGPAQPVCSLHTKRSVRGPTWMKVTCWDHSGLVSGRLQGLSWVQARPGNQGSWKSAGGVHEVVGAGAARALSAAGGGHRIAPHAERGGSGACNGRTPGVDGDDAHALVLGRALGRLFNQVHDGCHGQRAAARVGAQLNQHVGAHIPQHFLDHLEVCRRAGGRMSVVRFGLRHVPPGERQHCWAARTSGILLEWDAKPVHLAPKLLVLEQEVVSVAAAEG